MQVHEAPCPNCGQMTLSLRMEMVAKPLGTFSLSGSGMKVSASMRPVMHCMACGLWHVGEIDGRHVVFPPLDGGLPGPPVDQAGVLAEGAGASLDDRYGADQDQGEGAVGQGENDDEDGHTHHRNGR